MDRETVLLLECARAVCGETDCASLRSAASAPLDWDRVLVLGFRNAMLPLIYHRLAQSCADLAPAEVLQTLRQRFEANARKNLLMTGRLSEAIEALGEAGIRSLAFKGPTLAVMLYGNLAMREFCDLDLLVDPANAEAAKNILLEQGFEMPAEFNVTLHTSHEKHYALTANGGKVLLDLHWQLTLEHFPFSLTMEELAAEAATVTLGSSVVRSFSPEHLLLYLCAHGCWHCWERMEWICCVARLVSVCPGIQWQKTFDDAARLGAERMLALGLTLAADVGGVTYPVQVRERVSRISGIAELAAAIQVRLFAEPDGADLLGAHSLRVQMRELATHKLSYVRFVLHDKCRPNQNDRTVLQMPRFLSALYYVIRPVRLMREYGLRPLRHLRYLRRSGI